MEIVWSKRAESSYFKIRKHIRKGFSAKEEASFVQQVFETLATIESFPKAFPETNMNRIKATRKAVIHPHSSVFYRIETKKRVRLLLFGDNRNDPRNMKLRKEKSD